MYSIKNILVPTDFSEYSAAAIPFAESLGVQKKATIHMLHVIADVSVGLVSDVAPFAGLGRPAGAAPSTREVAMREELNRFVSEHVDEYTYIEQAIVTGQPEKEILRYVRDHHIDLIIMATHGRTGLAHILIGSIAEKIVRHSPVPVLTVKPTEVISPIITPDDIEHELHLADSRPETNRYAE